MYIQINEKKRKNLSNEIHMIKQWAKKIILELPNKTKVDDDGIDLKFQ